MTQEELFSNCGLSIQTTGNLWRKWCARVRVCKCWTPFEEWSHRFVLIYGCEHAIRVSIIPQFVWSSSFNFPFITLCCKLFFSIFVQENKISLFLMISLHCLILHFHFILLVKNCWFFFVFCFQILKDQKKMIIIIIIQTI